MTSARETFLAQVRTPDLDVEVFELRTRVTSLKRDALQEVIKGDEQSAREVMPKLYEDLIHAHVQMAGHVGVGVSFALTLLDEHHSGASLSRFDRELRDQITETSVEVAKRHGSRITRMIAEVEAQRLAWRHSHEFMSWLAFRRGDDRYPAKDRLERLNAFGVMPRLLEARAIVVRHLGLHLSAALEGSDRFLLGNRWRLSDSPEHALERYVWPLLSYMPATTVKIERQRLEFDCVVESGTAEERLDGEKAKLAGLLEAQLADALNWLPDSAMAGTF